MPGGEPVAKPQYGYAHQQAKEAWRPTVDAGEATCAELVCVMASRWIPPGAPWDLAHDTVNGGYLGPAHARCNRREGAARGNRMRRRRRPAVVDLDRPAESMWWTP